MTRHIRIAIISGIVIISAIAIALGYAAYSRFFADGTRTEISKAQISDVKGIVRLCAVDIYREVPVLDTIGHKVIFGIQKQQGSISFDLENLHIDDGDTIRMVLPPEIVELHESTEKNSWKIIDSKAIGPLSMLRSDKLTDKEENLVKKRISKRAVSQLYTDGTVRRARKEGTENLRQMMESIYRRPVIVTDSTPAGAKALVVKKKKPTR